MRKKGYWDRRVEEEGPDRLEKRVECLLAAVALLAAVGLLAFVPAVIMGALS